MDQPHTHLTTSKQWVGSPVELGKGKAIVELETQATMAVDEYNLVHGGFIFGLADYAAMLSINHPNVVLGGSSNRFLKPVVAGEKVVATATLTREDGKKKIVEVVVTRGDETVFTGEFTCFIPEKHVLA
jgi:acyl-coenzyme A thioesterase PaaI-like protein